MDTSDRPIDFELNDTFAMWAKKQAKIQEGIGRSNEMVNAAYVSRLLSMNNFRKCFEV